MKFENNVPFDPGYAQNLVPFLPTLEQATFRLRSFRNINQQKMFYKTILPICQKALKSTLGFWVGCVLWAGYIKYAQSDKKISGNNFLNLKKEDLDGFEYLEEFKAIKGYIENYSQNVKYYTGKDDKLDENFIKIVETYQNFLAMNEHFINVKTSSDIKIPQELDFMQKYTLTEFDNLLDKIEKIIEGKDLSKFLDLNLI
jgi:hypothetical protein